MRCPARRAPVSGLVHRTTCTMDKNKCVSWMKKNMHTCSSWGESRQQGGAGGEGGGERERSKEASMRVPAVPGRVPRKCPHDNPCCACACLASALHLPCLSGSGLNLPVWATPCGEREVSTHPFQASATPAQNALRARHLSA